MKTPEQFLREKGYNGFASHGVYKNLLMEYAELYHTVQTEGQADLLADDAKKLKLICPIHGEQDFETLYIIGIKLKCGCCWDSFDKKGLVYKIQKGKAC